MVLQAKHGILGLFKSLYHEASESNIKSVQSPFSPTLTDHRIQRQHSLSLVLRDGHHRSSHSCGHLWTPTLLDRGCRILRRPSRFRQVHDGEYARCRRYVSRAGSSWNES